MIVDQKVGLGHSYSMILFNDSLYAYFHVLELGRLWCHYRAGCKMVSKAFS